MNWYLEVFEKFDDFKGRTRRKEYWYFNLINLLIVLVLWGASTQWGIILVLFFIYDLVVGIPALAVGVRRLHDSGKSGYWLFIGLVPILGSLAIIYFMIQPSQPQENKYGPVPE
jgi:uncharacterized membrane protein YhaH (DUF805 family)